MQLFLISLNVNGQGPNLEIDPASGVVASGNTITIPFTVRELHQIVQINGSITWDPSVLAFDAVSYYGLPYMTSSTFNTSLTSSGTLSWMWQHLISIGGTLADGDSIFSIRFTAVGSVGQQSSILLGNTPVTLYWYNFAAWSGPIVSNPAQVFIMCSPGSEPTSGFSYNSNGLAVSFNDNSTNSPASWWWDFGDGTTDTVQNPVHIYATTDTFTVCLIASNGCGQDTSCTTVITGLTTGNANSGLMEAVDFYPNPAVDKIYFTGEVDLKEVYLVNMKGEKIDVKLNDNSIGIAEISTGIYFIGISESDKTTWSRIVIGSRH